MEVSLSTPSEMSSSFNRRVGVGESLPASSPLGGRQGWEEVVCGMEPPHPHLAGWAQLPPWYPSLGGGPRGRETPFHPSQLSPDKAQLSAALFTLPLLPCLSPLGWGWTASTQPHYTKKLTLGNTNSLRHCKAEYLYLILHLMRIKFFMKSPILKCAATHMCHSTAVERFQGPDHRNL